jgi:hypothetical protein
MQKRLFYLRVQEAMPLFRVMWRIEWQGISRLSVFKADEQEEKDSHGQIGC